MLANSTVCNGAMRVIVRIFTALSVSMRMPACASSVRQQLRFLNARNRLRDDRDVHNFRDVAPHVYARADFDCMSSSPTNCSQMLSPSAVELVAGVVVRLGDSPLCPRYDQFDKPRGP